MNLFALDELVGVLPKALRYKCSEVALHPVIGKIVEISTFMQETTYSIRISNIKVLNGVKEYDISGLTKNYKYQCVRFDAFLNKQDPHKPFFYIGDFTNYVDKEREKGRELLRFSKQCIEYDKKRPEYTDNYTGGWLNLPAEMAIKKTPDDVVSSLLYSVPTFYATKEGINAMFGVPKFEYKKIIFSGPCTIILWMDGTKTMARASENEMFDPEKGVAICFMKRALGHTETNKILRKASKDFLYAIQEKADKDLEDMLKRSTTPMDEFLPKGVKYESWSFDEDAARIVEKAEKEAKKKIEEKEFRSCFTCKYSGQSAIEKPCDVCVTNSRYVKGEKDD